MIKVIKNYTKIFKNIKLPWLLLVFVVALSVINSHVEVESVTLTASIIDGTKKTVNTDLLIRYVEFIFLSGLITIALTYISNLAYQKINLAVRLKLWNKMMRIETKYYDTDNIDELVTRVTTDADCASNYFKVGIQLFTAIYAAIVAYQKLFEFQVKMAAAILLIIPLTIGITVLYSTFTYKAGAQSRNRLAETMGYLAEHVRGLRIIKSFHMEECEQKKANKIFNQQCKADILLSYASMIQLGGMEFIGCICIVISFLMGSYLVNSGELTIGVLIGFYSLSGLATVRMAEICTYFGSFSQNAGIVQKISKILEVGEETTEGIEMDIADADITIENISFSYNQNKVLRDISCVIPKGKITAIVGTNGAGKSTLFKLLERMYKQMRERYVLEIEILMNLVWNPGVDVLVLFRRRNHCF